MMLSTRRTPRPSLLLLALLSPATIAHAQSDSGMPVVVVNGARVDPANPGTRADGYRVAAPYALGPLGSSSLLDTPHSIEVLPASLIEDQQISSLRQALNYMPLVQFQEQQGSEVLRPATRGMQGNNYQNTRMDGMTMFVTGANAMEAVQQLEVFTGSPAAAFGPANPAGMFNFVSKRPTAQTLARASVRYETGSIVTSQVDLGGQVGASGMLGYRINLLSSNGSGFVDHSDLNRKLGSVALDIRPTRDATLELNYQAHDLTQKGYPGWFTYGQATTLPAAPDPTRVGFGQEYAGVDLHNRIGSARLTGKLGANWRYVIGALDQSVDRNINTPVNNLTNNSGAYTASLANGFAPHFGIDSNVAYLNGRLVTGAIGHDLTFGTTGFKAITNALVTAAPASSVLLGSASIDNPLVFPLPAAGLPDIGNQYRSSIAWQQGVNLGDTMSFSPQWQLKLAASNDRMTTDNYNAKGVLTSHYDAHGWSPMPSVIFKPRADVTTYLTYASSLQQGDLGPAGSANANQSLAPYRSKQVEAGMKVALSKLDLSMALFRLERPFANTDPVDNVFKISGQQVNVGMEAQAAGEIAPHLVVYGGITLLDPKLNGTGNPATDGKQYVGMPKARSNILLDYQLAAIPGLALSADWQHIGKRPANDTNTTFAAAADVFNLGLNYASTVLSKAVTWRLMVNNVADARYWSTIGPATITGTNKGNMVAHIGAPRTAALSMSVDL
ncbi:MAG TPA: TonB-dependent siderophore receptor [Telluria sp.]|nr:TonB-dependent siderophore receptor [Telluria sp.]